MTTAPNYDLLVQRIIQTVANEDLTNLRRDFHTRMRITLNQPDESELVEDLWDFFYDWCIFEQRLPEQIDDLSAEEKSLWDQVKNNQLRSLYQVVKSQEDSLKVKDLFLGKTYQVLKREKNDFVGIHRGDILEARLVKNVGEGDTFHFARKPSYHHSPVHSYIKKKIKQFKKSKDQETYQAWLWLLVGMYIKHRIYNHMPIEKIYDDQSRI